MADWLTIEVYRIRNTHQLSINRRAENGTGEGYRLAGPTFNGSGETLLTKKLTGQDAAEIRKYLDAAFPVAAREQGTPPDAETFPLTCTWCSNSPATHLAVADWSFPDGPQRLEFMLCANCAHGVTVLPGGVAAWWLFALVPDDPHGCKGGFR